MNTQKIRDILIDLFKTYTECDDIIEALRSLETEKEITEEEYDYAIKHYDEILKEVEADLDDFDEDDFDDDEFYDED